MNRSIILMISFTLLFGCSNTTIVPIDMLKVKASKPTSLSISNREKPDFSAMTAGKAMFALIGAFAMISAGNKIVTENNIIDPANNISIELAKALSSKLKIKAFKNKNTTKSTDFEELSKTYSANHLLIDVQTLNWSFAYFPTDWNNYRVIYSAKLRIIDTRSKTQIAEGFCSSVPEQNEKSPNYDDLLANNAQRIKSELKIAANKCIAKFKQTVLKIQ